MPSQSGPALFELRALRVFMEVATTRSMTAAAARLGLTQSAVSQAVRRLEGELGVDLMHRGQRPMSLTAAGERLARDAVPLLRDASRLVHALRDVSRTPVPEVRLGLVDSFASTAGPELIRELTGETARVVLWSGLAPSLGAALVAGEVDAIVTADALEDLDGLRRQMLWKESFVLLLPRALRSRGAGATLEALASELSLIRYSARSHTGLLVERHLRRLGIVAERRIEVDGSDALVAMVAAGVGWAITTPICLLQGAAHAPGVLAVPMPSPRFSRTLCLVSREDGPADLADRIAAAALHVLRRTCLPRLQSLAPAVLNTVLLGDQQPNGEGTHE